MLAQIRPINVLTFVKGVFLLKIPHWFLVDLAWLRILTTNCVFVEPIPKHNYLNRLIM